MRAIGVFCPWLSLQKPLRQGWRDQLPRMFVLYWDRRLPARFTSLLCGSVVFPKVFKETIRVAYARIAF